MVKSYLTTHSLQTKKLGEKLAKEILKTKSKKKAVIVGLEGDLGSGKTTFLQGFAKGLGIKEKILSPTFIIMKKFKIKVSRFKNFYHIDCYRISKPKEILNLGFKKIISNPKNIIAIEWADQIKEILPKNTLILKFEFIEKIKRKIKYRTNYRG
jgi:tRNA threonylcarbamoyladenosine biosynthesis protein TsaE